MAQGIGVEADATGTSIPVSRHPASQSGTGSLRFRARLATLILVPTYWMPGSPPFRKFKKIVRGEK
jgi:hypothetical protein